LGAGGASGAIGFVAPVGPVVSAPRRVASASPARRAAGALLRAPTPLIFGASLTVALVLLRRQGTLADLGTAARGADLAIIVLAALLYLLGLALLCLRWHALVRMVAGRSDPARAAEAFLASVAINYAAPIGLAVPARAALTKRGLGLTTTETGAIALWEVGADVLALGAVSAVWLAAGNGAILGRLPGGPGAALAVVAGGVAFGAAALAVAVRRPVLRRRVGVAGVGLLRYPGRQPRAAIAALGLTAAFWLLQGPILALLLGAVGVDASAGLVIGLLSLPVLVGMLSPVPGGAGVREALMVAVAQARGANGGAVLLAAVAYRAALFAAIPLLYAAVRVWLAVRARADRRRQGEPA